MRRVVVERTPEFDRVMALRKRREPSSNDVVALSKWLRRRGSSAMLFHSQAAVLLEWERRGAVVGNLRVGDGKTLPSLLAATLAEADDPLLVVPSALVVKTRKEARRYAEDWHIRVPKIVSYEFLGSKKQHAYLGGPRKKGGIQPTHLIFDEAGFVRNFKSTRARRIDRYVKQCDPDVMLLDGSMLSTSGKHYWHLLGWALNDLSPWPRVRHEAETWAQALKGDQGLDTVGLGVLEHVPGGVHQWTATRRGVVVSTTEGCDASIYLSLWRPTIPDALQDVIDYVEETNETPDGIELDPFQKARVMMELSSVGLYHTWDPHPPEWWDRPRRDVARFVRDKLDEFDPEVDSMARVFDAYGDLPIFRKWSAVAKKFTPNSVARWVTDALVRQAADVPKGTLIWCRSVAAAIAIAKVGGYPYHGRESDPLRHRGKTIVVGDSHMRGNNFQHDWHRMRVVQPNVAAEIWEQRIGRIHRTGQKEPVVYCDVNVSTDYLARVVARARANGATLTEVQTYKSKLCLADWIDE